MAMAADSDNRREMTWEEFFRTPMAGRFAEYRAFGRVMYGPVESVRRYSSLIIVICEWLAVQNAEEGSLKRYHKIGPCSQSLGAVHIDDPVFLASLELSEDGTIIFSVSAVDGKVIIHPEDGFSIKPEEMD